VISPPQKQCATLSAARAEASSHKFWPRGTVRCVGEPAFRTQAARDVGCLLDVDHDVSQWACLPLVLTDGDKVHVPDFLAMKSGRRCLIDAGAASSSPQEIWIKSAAARLGYAYELWPEELFADSFRLANARDLMRYVRWTCPLGDRVRLLAALEEAGSLTIAECLPAFTETHPIAGIASLILQRFLDVELDASTIGPETVVRRFRA
jgi:hypothetical protein